MARVEFINIQNRIQTINQLIEWFDQFVRIPQTIVTCPGGLVRSEYFAYFMEANRWGVCHPANVKSDGEDRELKGLAVRQFRVRVSRDRIIPIPLEGHNEKPINAAVLCGDPFGEPSVEHRRILKEIEGRIPVLILKGMEGHFTYLCSNANKT